MCILEFFVEILSLCIFWFCLSVFSFRSFCCFKTFENILQGWLSIPLIRPYFPIFWYSLWFFVELGFIGENSQSFRLYWLPLCRGKPSPVRPPRWRSSQTFLGIFVVGFVCFSPMPLSGYLEIPRKARNLGLNSTSLLLSWERHQLEPRIGYYFSLLLWATLDWEITSVNKTQCTLKLLTILCSIK